MGPPTVGFKSYVEIAVCMANQDSDPEDLKQLIENIRKWQELYPGNRKRVEDTSLPDLQFSDLFLQHPFPAMSLWNVMQRFYALDRLVCSTSKESLEKIREWEKMPLFEYLEARKVERRWRSSLQELGRGIKESSKQEETPLPQKDNVLFLFSEKHSGSKGTSKANNDRIKSEVLLRRIDGIYSGIAKLDASLRELQRSLKENLKDVDLGEKMLKKIVATAGIRWSMIDTYLKMDENSESGDMSDYQSDGTQFPSKPAPLPLPILLRESLARFLKLRALSSGFLPVGENDSQPKKIKKRF
jgi:hypothetical protein